MDIPAVVSMSPDIAAFAPERKTARPLSTSSPRPPAMRIAASGKMNRKSAAARRISSYASRGNFSYGVPGIGFSTLSGTDFTPSARSSKAMSARSAKLSPMPIMPPLQTSSLARIAAFIAAILSS